MSKYKAGDKFIIEIEDVLHIESDKGLWVEPWYLVNGMEGAYFEEDDLDSFERYDKDAYEEGRADGSLEGYSRGMNEHMNDIYKQGLNDAWKCARKLVHSRAPEEWDIMCDLFSVERGRQCDIIAKTTASEAIEKLRDYEAKKDEIKVGDEVRLKDLGLIGVVTRLADLEQAACIMFDDGSATWKSVNGAKKTGRHFPIEDILEQMRGE